MRYLLSLFIALPLVAPAQPPQVAPVQVSEPNLRTTVNEVLLDLVVRDKHGHIIHDLRPDEIQVFEDGTPQKLRHFEFVDGHSGVPGPTPPAPDTAIDSTTPGISATSSATPTAQPRTVNELRDISMISIVIANLDPRGRKLALDALQQFVKSEIQPNIYIGVYTLGMEGLRLLQPYTNEADKISSAVDAAAQTALIRQLATPNQSTLPSTGLGRADAPMVDTNDPLLNVLPTPIGPQGANTGPLTGATAMIAEMMETHWMDELHDVYTDSMRYLSPLRTLVQAQAEIPGRKVVLLLSAGLPVHLETVEPLKAVISAANRSNVSIYALDTRGVTTQSTLDGSRRLLQAAVDYSRRQQLSTVIGGDQAVLPGMVLAEELAQTSVDSDSRANLAALAEGTGGSLLPDTLDLREPLREALEDARTHYELTYSPANSGIDGNFRKIAVKVTRPGALVFARSGYYALPVVNGQQVYPFEMATLKALHTKPELHQFAFRAAVLQFRPGPVRTQMDFIFQAPIHDLQVTRDGQWVKVHVDVTALVKNDQGQVVEKISKDIPYEEPASKIAELKRGVVSFTAPFHLPPGHYAIDTAAVDRNSMKASVSHTTIDLGEPSGLSMSDVTVARRVDPIHGPTTPSDPFEARGGKITPELSGDFAYEDGGKVEFYAVGYPAAPVDASVEMNFELWLNGKLFLRSPGSPIPPDPSGAASVLVSVPTQKLPIGSYEARVAFQYKGQTVSKSVSFTVGIGS
jgi:VWFA-related protein